MHLNALLRESDCVGSMVIHLKFWKAPMCISKRFELTGTQHPIIVIIFIKIGEFRE